MCKKCQSKDLLLVNILVYLEYMQERTPQDNEVARQEFIYEIEQETASQPAQDVA